MSMESTCYCPPSVPRPLRVSELLNTGMYVPSNLAESDAQYTSFWNLVNYPAAVFPTGLYVDPTLDEELYESSNDHEDWIKQTYSATASAGVSDCDSTRH